jgi:glycosyltransferase involved in cell wall biosynthesis
MDIGVLCSQSEGFSNSILEFLAVGLPCVATDVGGNREAVGDAGRIVPNDDVQELAREILALSRTRTSGTACRRPRWRVRRVLVWRSARPGSCRTTATF